MIRNVRICCVVTEIYFRQSNEIPNPQKVIKVAVSLPLFCQFLNKPRKFKSLLDLNFIDLKNIKFIDVKNVNLSQHFLQNDFLSLLISSLTTQVQLLGMSVLIINIMFFTARLGCIIMYR